MSLWIFSPVLKGMLPRIDLCTSQETQLKRALEAQEAQAQVAQAQVAQAQKGPGSQTQIALGQILKKGQAQNSPKVYAREGRPRPHVEFEGDGVRKYQDSTTRRVYADGRASAEPDRHVKIFSEKS